MLNSMAYLYNSIFVGLQLYMDKFEIMYLTVTKFELESASALEVLFCQFVIFFCYYEDFLLNLNWLIVSNFKQ